MSRQHRESGQSAASAIKRYKRPSKRRASDGCDLTPYFPSALGGLGKPIALHPYCDVIDIWLRDPIGSDELDTLQRLCGGELGHRVRKPRFRRDSRPELEYAQRLTLRQPSDAALHLLSKRNDVFLNYSELALDRIYRTRDEQQAAFQFQIENALIKDRRRGRRRGAPRMRVCLGTKGATFYSGPRRAIHLAVTYADKPSKVAKSSVAPLHDERRTRGPRAHKRKGIATLAEIKKLDPTEFWRKNARYYRVTDVEGLGRAYSNYYDRQIDPTKPARRKARLKELGGGVVMNVDKRVGHLLMRVLGQFKPEQITLSKAAKKANKTPMEMSGYWSVMAARSIQNLHDRLNCIIPMDRFISRIDPSASLIKQDISELAQDTPENVQVKIFMMDDDTWKMDHSEVFRCFGKRRSRSAKPKPAEPAKKSSGFFSRMDDPPLDTSSKETPRPASSKSNRPIVTRKAKARKRNANY